MLPYLTDAVERFLKMLPSGPEDVLEVGSDIPAKVVYAIAGNRGGRVVGLNPSLDFPNVDHRDSKVTRRVHLVRGDGRFLPFPDESFVAVLSVAVLEHVDGLRQYLQETSRVLRPRGLAYLKFGPLWTSAKGHHVYAKHGSKEARFWKPGKNPVPDYAHLLMSPEEMRTYLRSGPCCEELIEPIIQWIYFDDAINRASFEDYIETFRECSLKMQSFVLMESERPESEVMRLLHEKYGTGRNFTCSGMSLVLRKRPESRAIGGHVFDVQVGLHRVCQGLASRIAKETLRRFPEIKTMWLGDILRNLKRRIFP